MSTLLATFTRVFLLIDKLGVTGTVAEKLHSLQIPLLEPPPALHDVEPTKSIESAEAATITLLLSQLPC